jgi:ParB/RepB/Spo0J family partition protein
MKKAAAVKMTKVTTKAPTKMSAKMAKKLEPASIEEPVTMEARDLEADLIAVVVEAAQVNGSTPISWSRILGILKLPPYVEEREWGLKIFDALIDRGIVEKGVLVHDAPETLRILEEAAKAPAPAQAVAVQIAQPPSAAQLITVPIGEVVVCPLNPRKQIHEGDIEEMADSILEHDIVQPPVARPGKYQGTYEVVFGQRRLLGKRRAIAKAKEAGDPISESIQLLVREMDDRTVLEEAWIENLQRVDVGVRDEVEGFQAMLDLRGEDGRPIYTLESLAARFGKKKTFVSERLNLRHVPEEMWRAHEEGLIGLRQMALVGKLPTEAMRKKAAGMVLRPDHRTEDEPLTVRETARMLSEHFMKSLRGCAWDLADEDLVPAMTDKGGRRICGGACEDCPSRTGSAAELQGSLSGGSQGGTGKDANSCMMPSCYEKKHEAFAVRALREASEKGSKVLTPDEAKRVFQSWGSGGVSASCGYVSLSEYPSYMETGHHAGEDTLPAWGEMIREVDPKLVTAGRSPMTGEVHYLLPREKAIELAELSLKKSGSASPFANRPGARNTPSVTGDDDDEDVETDGGGSSKSTMSEWQLRHQRQEKVAKALLGKLLEAVDLQKALPEEVMTELILGTLWEEMNFGSGLIAHLVERGMPQFDDSHGDDDEKAKAYLDGVVRPEIARAPLAWAALALFEVYDQLIDLDVPMQSDGLLLALNLDRETIVDGEETAEEEEVEG